jgi:hypothetical protein
MNIEIPYKDKTYYIESNDSCFFVYEKATSKDGNEYTTDTTYHALLEQALNEIFNRCCKNSQANSITELIEDIKSIRKEILKEYSINFNSSTTKQNVKKV